MTKRDSVDYEKKKKTTNDEKGGAQNEREKEGGAVKKGVLLAIKLPHTESSSVDTTQLDHNA